MDDNFDYDEIDHFIHTNKNTSQVSYTIPLTHDQLLAQNARLVQQIQEQQRMINMQNLLAQQMYQSQQHGINKKIKKSGIDRITSQASLKETTPVPIQEIKGNVKNAYIKKITSLLSVEGEQLIDDELKVDLQSSSESVPQFKLSGLLCQGNELFSENAKNKRLRKSAKQSRLRKKVYLKLLEKKVSDLDSKIQQYRDGTKQSFDYLTQLLASHPILNSMIIGQSQAIEQVLQCQQPDQAQLLLDSYQMRYGVTGIKRRDYIKYAIKNMQRNFLKGNYGLQLVSLDTNHRNYDQEFNHYVDIVKQTVKIEDENLIYRVLPTIEKLLKHRTQSQIILKNLNQQAKSLKNITQEIEETATSFTQNMTPVQQLELIKQVEINHLNNRGL